MAKRFVRCAAIVGATTLALSLQMTGISAGAPGGPTVPSRGQSSADELPADLVSALRRDLDMSPGEYLDRAASAHEVDGFAEALRRSDPSGYAGAWLDADGTPTVAVTRPELAATVTGAGFRAEFTPFGASFREGAQARATPPDVHFQAASAMVSAGAAIGGDGYITTTVPIDEAERYLVCSFGFTASDATGQPLALSAGHCDPNPAATGTATAAQVYEPEPADLRTSSRVGSFATSGIGDTGGGLDYSVIALTPDAAVGTLGQPAVRGRDGSVLRLTGTGNPVAGAPVCKSGQTSHYTCGVVLDTDETLDMSGSGGELWTVRGFTHSACTLGGDSGGAIVSGTVAVGITSGSSTASAPSCGAVPPDEAMGLGMRIADVLAELNGPAASCATGPRISVRTTADPSATLACGGVPSGPSDGAGNGTGSLGSLR
ncbi:hypothetical protein C8K36_10958 [Rhodococcus sp. OK519]|uniref:S1 family peptidase n=1 Tax=Rhodococcus sp. OK519 TaxID=2135729 RepID=UPI000D3BC96A|nr:hypothetical protein C8K36_10958 [Rhodococcus sp. OK519]